MGGDDASFEEMGAQGSRENRALECGDGGGSGSAGAKAAKLLARCVLSRQEWDFSAKYFGLNWRWWGADGAFGSGGAVDALRPAPLSFPLSSCGFHGAMVFFNNMIMIPGNGVTWQRLLFF